MFFILLFSVTASSVIQAQYLSKSDSIRRVIQSKSGNEKSSSLIELSHLTASTNSDSALLLLTQSITTAQSQEMKGKACFEKALLYRYLGKDLEQALYLDTAYRLLSGINDTIAGNVLHYKNILLGNKGQYQKALQAGHQEVALFNKLSLKDNELNAMLQIGYTYDRMGDYHKAIEWYNKGMKLEGVKNEDYIGRNYGLMGIAYDELEDFEKAVYYNLKAIEHFKKKDNSVFLHTWYSNLGNTYTKMGKLDLAEKYTLLALQDNKRKRYVTIINLGKIYLEKGAIKKAETTLKKVLEDLEQTDQPVYLSEAYYTLHQLYKKKGDYKTALTYFEKYNLTEKNRLSIEKTKQLNELTIQYETAEKEKLLLEQKAKITDHQLALKNRNLWIFGLSSLVITIGLIGFLLYKQQLLKNIKQQQESEIKLALEKIDAQNKLQQQRLNISRDLHDNIGAQLTFIISAIETIKLYAANKQNQLNKKLDNIAIFAKETIQELRDTIWAMNKSEITLQDLQTRMANFIEKAKQSHPNIHIPVFIDDGISKNTVFTGVQGLNIFRIVQEAVNNTFKHADASEITIAVTKNENNIHFKIKDNGKGFEEMDIEPGNGLMNIRKRALDLGSELKVQSEQGNGTTIEFNIIPLGQKI
ncbi:MAG: ATP-binding protein [Niabella sp.]